MFIGKRLKELRKEKKITLTELSKLSGVQLATLSRIENMKMTGTLQSHMDIAAALGVTLPTLYGDMVMAASQRAEPQPAPAQNAFMHSEKAAMEILTTGIFAKKMMPALLRLEPGGTTTREQNPAGTEKFLYILEGAIEVEVGSEKYTLAKGNSLYFDASLPYYMENKGKSAAKVLCVGSPVSL